METVAQQEYSANGSMSDGGYTKAVECLEAACTPQGILASLTDTSNYRRVWARDSIICGLAGLISENPRLTEGLKATLRTLAKYQGPHGQIPSNIAFGDGGEATTVSYGRLVGRVDTVPWFVIGLCNYSALTKDMSLAFDLYQAAENALALMESWEFNNRGLVYCPLSSDWADEYFLQGYVLLTQLLRLWALECFAGTYDEDCHRERAADLRSLIEKNYWPTAKGLEGGTMYAPPAARACVEQHGDATYWVGAFSPAGYVRQFDFFANALALLLGIGTTKQQVSSLQHGTAIISQLTVPLTPAFWPPVYPESYEWSLLEHLYLDHFRNKPHEYHNGGIWPMLSGWWGIAQVLLGQTEEAHRLLLSLHQFNQRDVADGSGWGFYECGNSLTGEISGTRLCSWSAAAVVLLTHALNGKRLSGWRA
jgi:hypothetical protein